MKLAKRARTRECRRCGAGRDYCQKRRRIGAIGPGTLKCLWVILEAFANRAVPALDGVGRPLWGFVCVTIVTGVGSAKLHGKIGPWDSKAVIVPLVDHHVGTDRHVARRARDLRCHVTVVGVRGNFVVLGCMTLQTYAVAFHPQPGGMWLVAIAAGDAGRKHPALLE